jgi:hypothetical protein
VKKRVTEKNVLHFFSGESPGIDRGLYPRRIPDTIMEEELLPKIGLNPSFKNRAECKEKDETAEKI